METREAKRAIKIALVQMATGTGVKANGLYDFDRGMDGDFR